MSEPSLQDQLAGWPAKLMQQQMLLQQWACHNFQSQIVQQQMVGSPSVVRGSVIQPPFVASVCLGAASGNNEPGKFPSPCRSSVMPAEPSNNVGTHSPHGYDHDIMTHSST